MPEAWSPELWHPDSRTGKMKRQRLPTDEKSSSPEAEPTTMITEVEQPSYIIPSTTLLPVEEEDSEAEGEGEEEQDESLNIFS